MRPRFLEIMTRLEAMSNESSSTGSFATHPSTSSHGSHSSYGSDTSTGSGREGVAAITAVGGVKPPSGEMAIVFTDIVRSLALWEFNAEVCCPLSFVVLQKKRRRNLNMYHLQAMKDATLMHNKFLRKSLAQFEGYEVAFLREGISN